MAILLLFCFLIAACFLSVTFLNRNGDSGPRFSFLGYNPGEDNNTMMMKAATKKLKSKMKSEARENTEYDIAAGSVMTFLIAAAMSLTVGDPKPEATPLIEPTASSSAMFDEPREEGVCLIYRGRAGNLVYITRLKMEEYVSWQDWAYNIRYMAVLYDFPDNQDELIFEEQISPETCWVGCRGTYYGVMSGEEEEIELMWSQLPWEEARKRLTRAIYQMLD